MSSGILVIFAWRIVAKYMCHHILPPTFRFLAQLFTLPHRRYYTPATDYTNVPADNLKGLRAIPSVLDLPGMVKVEADGVSTGRTSQHTSNSDRQIKQRGTKNGSNGHAHVQSEKAKDEYVKSIDSELGWKRGVNILHYDADGESLCLMLRRTKG